MIAPGVWVDGRAEGLPADDRGLAYGDGVFETVLCVDGRPVWWDAHLSRLERGAAVLGFVAPERDVWQRDAERALAHADPGAARCVLKLLLTRGSGARGYAVRAPSRPRRVVSIGPAPEVDGAAREGLRLRWCRTALAVQPALAGIKHLNRLEQVLARQEWIEAEIDEGLMCDTQGRAVSAISGNLLCLTRRGWLTPPVDQAGIAGLCRARLLAEGLVSEAELRPDDVMAAEALAVCNSVRGILPVRQLDQRGWAVGGALRDLQRALARLEAAFHHSFLDDALA
ncbi:aminodeoxychorismate lyase [Pseudomarimonas salicorniae]|uniref:Aminodeoxychorismate lyase n=1 Tax=Pseudomarimonas salicorniae TaxID=2933270 RepID=A0ABT0GJJ9_9GAMM|nr:aminodeoxychorismate lyase [Lysobacter sp. CAU 1642]MCK7594725.1 aminodeoxychorismate lyase [Lysobacter sp. CAU 1642]